MKVRPMLGTFGLEDIEFIESSESRALVEHRVPGLEGSYFQDLGSVPNTIVITGTKHGDEQRDEFLEGIRELFNAGEPTTFVADINTATDLTDVVIEDLQVTEVAGSPDTFRYTIKLRKYIEPPAPPATGLLDTGILDDALKLTDALDLIDAFGSIPNLGNPIEPLRGTLEGILTASGGLDETVNTLQNLFGEPGAETRPEATPSSGQAVAGQAVKEGTAETVPLAEDLRIDPADPRIDGAAGTTLQNMLETPETAGIAAVLIQGINGGGLAGILGADSDVAEQLARAHGTEPSLLVPSGQDATLVLDAELPLEAPPTILLRSEARDDPARLGAALEEAGRTFALFQRDELGPCDSTPSAIPVPNLVPSTFCHVPTGDLDTVEEKGVTRGLFGMFFETDKTFLLPSAMRSIRGLNRFHKNNPGGELLVVGHTDRVGPEIYNTELSKLRAQNMAAYLQDTVETWLAFYQPQTISKQWGTREDQHMLSALPEGGPPFYTAEINGIADANTKKAVTQFQEFFNANRDREKLPALEVDGFAGQDTRRELVKTYMELDGTSLPEDTPLFIQGCGEFHPEVPTGDEVPEARNRRTEAFFFPETIDPPIPVGGCRSPGCVEYPQWRDRARFTIDFTKTVVRIGWTEVLVNGLPEDVLFRIERKGGPVLNRGLADMVDDAGSRWIELSDTDSNEEVTLRVSSGGKEFLLLDRQRIGNPDAQPRWTEFLHRLDPPEPGQPDLPSDEDGTLEVTPQPNLVPPAELVNG